MGTGDRPYDILEPPSVRETPVVVEVPHAGLAIPPEILAQIAVPSTNFARDADLFVDQLYADAPQAGATLLRGTVSRYVIDLNRAEDDVDAESVEGASPAARAPRGVVWRLSGDGGKVFSKPLSRAELQRRLDAWHRPYHAELRRIVAHKLERFGIAVILAAHSMPSHARWASGELGPARADVVPGTRGRTSADGRFIDAVEAHASARRWTVRHDDPYRGGFTTMHYGRPRDRVHAVQVELARRLYMDEERLALHSRSEDVRQWCGALVAKLGELALR